MIASTKGSGGRRGTSRTQAAPGARTFRAASRARKPPPKRHPSWSARRRLLVACVVFAVFVAFLVAGLLLDEFQAVLANAATICLSCIGIE